MSPENVEAFKRGTEAYNRRDVDALLKELDPEVEWHSALLIPFGGEATVSRGHDGVREVLGELYEALAEIRLDYSEIRDLGDRIVGTGHIRTRGKQSGVVTEMAFGTVTDMKNGKGIRIWTYLDPKEALEAAGLSESAVSQENVEVVRQIYTEWQRGNMKAGVERFDPEIVFESFMPDASERIVANGPAEVEAFMREFLRDWRGYRLIGDEYREASETTVFVRGRQAAVGRESGAAVEDTMYSVWTFRDGRVVHLIFDRNRQRALEASGLSE